MTTGKNKIEFEKWYSEYIKEIHYRHHFICRTYQEFFDMLPFEMKIGVYLAYYDSLGYRVFAGKDNYGNKYGWNVNLVGYNVEDTLFEAYKAAFKEADKLRNKEM